MIYKETLLTSLCSIDRQNFLFETILEKMNSSSDIVFIPDTPILFGHVYIAYKTDAMKNSINWLIHVRLGTSDD